MWATVSAFLLWIPLGILFFFMVYRRRQRRAFVQFSSLKMIRSLSPGFRVRVQWLPGFLKLVALGLGIIALARPQRAHVKIKKDVEGIEHCGGSGYF